MFAYTRPPVALLPQPYRSAWGSHLSDSSYSAQRGHQTGSAGPWTLLSRATDSSASRGDHPRRRDTRSAPWLVSKPGSSGSCRHRHRSWYPHRGAAQALAPAPRSNHPDLRNHQPHGLRASPMPRQDREGRSRGARRALLP
ncbi:hypothetical protein B0H67DRAFT_579292 [Lasiosphaeris hirsuta]|uniref:Uncharacterized protein n=1 Tax=Lasiosphaeris hirsuta TaxID=260670 RepID=A0AA40DVM5_9PEZI|nr:hypothetical protein B0H67DRAFT_579292 [Lasiosphaeris hirsuta]